ncbi:hypothetical protein BDV93DRAFT_453871 [Ceratobasidium sp. AG-I]|nr:hypothetical protein BDV93DRAFT_453871 [Ceratobasidium sp. AG-I]
MGWSRRHFTRAAQKIPANAPQQLHRSFLRMACTIRDQGVPSSCIVNADQTQVVYSHGSQYTWNERGVRQVQVVGTEEKRAYTMLVGVSNNGNVLPFQAIYQGRTSVSLPNPNISSCYNEALAIGMQFLPSLTDTYWSTLETMQTYVTDILVPYFRTQQKKHGLPVDQHCIFQIDAWSVHRSKEFRLWMESAFPWIGLHYIPGGCTGLFQACDVALQRVAKIAMRRKPLSDIIDETTEALAGGADPTTFINDKTVKTLRNRSVSWMVEAYNAINKPELVQKVIPIHICLFNMLS